MNKKFLLLGILLILFSSFASAALTDNIVSYYKFDTDATDSLGTNDGTVTGGASLTTSSGGMINEAYDFDGSTGYISVGGTSDFEFNADYTICMWVDRDSVAANDFIFDKRDANNDGWFFGFLGSKLALNIDNSDTISSDTDTVADTSYFACGVVDRTGSGKTHLYLDGVEESSYSAQPTISGDTVSVTAIARIGQDSTGAPNTNGHDGLIDETAIWSRALSSAEMLDYYNAQVAGLQYPFTDLPINITSGHFTPNTSVFTTDSITAYAVLNSTASASVNYTIYKNNEVFSTGTSTTFIGNTATLGPISSVNTSQEDEFYFTAIAVNSSNTNQALSGILIVNNITIINRAAVLSNPDFSAVTLLNNSDFKGYVDATDADSDVLNLTWNLYLNRTGSFNSVANGVVTNHAVGADIELFTRASGDTLEGDEYYFTVIATDSFNNSNQVTSSTKTVVILDVWEFTLKSSYNNSLLEGVNVTVTNGTNSYSKLTDSNGFVTFREDVEGITGSSVNATITFDNYNNLASTTYSTGAYETLLSPEGVEFKFVNLFNNSYISGFTIELFKKQLIGDDIFIDNFTTTTDSLFIFSADSGTANRYNVINSSLEDTTGAIVTFVTATNYTTETDYSYQHKVVYTAEKKILGDTINTFNLTVPGGKNYSTTSGSVNVYLDFDNYSITGISSGYVNVVNAYEAINSTGIDTFYFGSAVLNLTAKSFNTNTTINNFSVLLQHANGYSELKSTTTGLISFGVVDNEEWQLFFDSDDYAGLYVNVTQTGNFTSYNATLFDFNSILITFKNELTNALITSLIDIELISSVESQTHNTTSGIFNVSLLSPVEWLIRYSSVNYDARTYYFNLVNNSFTNLTLYLIESNDTDRITVTVYDEYNYRVSDAYVKVLHYDVSSNAYLLTEVLKTDSNGESYFNAILEDDFYKFIVERPSGNIVFASSPSILTSTTLTLQVNLAEAFATDYFNFLDVSYTLTYNNATNNFVYTYSDANNIMESACLKVYEINSLGETLYDSSCASGSSNTLTVNIDNTSGTSYRADTFYNFGDEDIFVTSLYQDFKEKFEGGGLGVFLIALLTIVFMSIGLWNPTAAILLTPLPILLASIVGFVSISVGVTIPLMVLAMIVAYIINRG